MLAAFWKKVALETQAYYFSIEKAKYIRACTMLLAVILLFLNPRQKDYINSSPQVNLLFHFPLEGEKVTLQRKERKKKKMQYSQTSFTEHSVLQITAQQAGKWELLDSCIQAGSTQHPLIQNGFNYFNINPGNVQMDCNNYAKLQWSFIETQILLA